KVGVLDFDVGHAGLDVETLLLLRLRRTGLFKSAMRALRRHDRPPSRSLLGPLTTLCFALQLDQGACEASVPTHGAPPARRRPCVTLPARSVVRGAPGQIGQASV